MKLLTELGGEKSVSSFQLRTHVPKPDAPSALHRAPWVSCRPRRLSALKPWRTEIAVIFAICDCDTRRTPRNR